MSPIDLPSLALILAAAARGATHVAGTGLPDRAQLAVVLAALGARLDADGQGGWNVRGTGTGGWREPGRVLELGRAPGAVPLLAGMLAVQPFTSVLATDSGNASLSLAALRGPLERVGARLVLGRLDRLPGTVTGTVCPLPARHDGLGPVEGLSVLLAGLNSPGRTGVDDVPGLAPGLDMLRRFGVQVQVVDGTAWVTGYPDLAGADVTPGA